jgi:hypothetical protein
MSFCIAFLRQIITLHVIQRNVVLLSAIPHAQRRDVKKKFYVADVSSTT